MKLENAFEVPAAPEEVWAFMLDVERVAPCMPGAELTEVVDERTWRGKVTVKVGPVSLSYQGQVVMAERDDEGRRAVLKAEGRETKGKGIAQALVTSVLEATDGGTRVAISTDLTLSGAVAQYGRGMIGDVSQRLTNQFAECLAARLTAPPGEGLSPAAKPVAGLRLGIWALLRAMRRFLVRIWRTITGRGG